MVRFGSIAIGLSILVGCADSGLPTVPVSGHLTYGGGDWPKPGYVTFNPISVKDGLPQRPGTGRFREDGEFVVTSFQEGDGLLPGTYSVNVRCWLGQPNSSDEKSFERLNAVPKDFHAEDLVVDAGEESINLEIDVPKKK